MAKERRLPELLSPAGSFSALEAAIEAGADAVYFGTTSYSNRMRAKNFEEEEAVRAIRLCSSYGVASHITLNTRLRERELPSVLELAKRLWAAGASAFIVADVGLAGHLVREIPGVVLHGSTQLTGVSSADAEAMAKLGFSRMVCPRELTRKELCALVESSPIETEMFVHGALCVSVSGQCLMSWAMGGRSGNRGECAQPCRLPYSFGGGEKDYPLSLKDSCLASHIPGIIDSGVASLKIEGRMKGEDYVYGVTRIYRRLLDEGRCATAEELHELESLFSRDGFTDGYYTGKRLGMNGTRPEGAAESEGVFGGLKRKLPVKGILEAISGRETTLTLTEGELTVRVAGDVADTARSAAASAESTYKNISRLGGTAYTLAEGDFTFITDGRAFLPTSALNELRRRAVEALSEAKSDSLRQYRCDRESLGFKEAAETDEPFTRLASFRRYEDVPAVAWEYFDTVFLPYGEAEKAGGRASLALSPWTPDTARLKEQLASYRDDGGTRVLCHTLGQIGAAVDAGLSPVASFRLNVTNKASAQVLRDMGVLYTVLSPELPVAAMGDISRSVGNCGAVVYGHLPLMLLRRCVMKSQGCSGKCSSAGCLSGEVLKDRRGGELRVLAASEETNVITNSHVIWSADRQNELLDFGCVHFLFTEEAPFEAARVIESYRRGESPEAAGVRKLKRM